MGAVAAETTANTNHHHYQQTMAKPSVMHWNGKALKPEEVVTNLFLYCKGTTSDGVLYSEQVKTQTRNPKP
jgi:hypothetical protein